MTRQEHSLGVTDGTRTVTFEIEAITDLLDDTDRAQAFPTSQARATIHIPDGSTDQWILHRAEAGENVPSYTWMHRGTEQPIDQDELAGLLRSWFV